MSNNKFKILIVEDEPTICSFIYTLLDTNGYKTYVAPTCELGKSIFTSYLPDLIILDLGLPDRDGRELIHYVRQKFMTPIIVLSARTTEADKIEALDLGANDYITKPFSVREVLARVRSVLRRTSAARAESESIRFEGLEIDLRRKVCTLDGKELQLTKKEFEILALLLSNRGVIFSREEILRRIWSDEVIVLDRTVDVNITRLRRKVGPYGEHIVTRLGYGYGFEA